MPDLWKTDAGTYCLTMSVTREPGSEAESARGKVRLCYAERGAVRKVIEGVKL